MVSGIMRNMKAGELGGSLRLSQVPLARVTNKLLLASKITLAV